MMTYGVATSKGPTWAQIHAVTQQRQAANHPAVREMMAVRQRYNAEWVLPLPDVEGEPTMPNIGPALIAESIDNVALIASSIRPNMVCPPLQPDKERLLHSREYAEIRSKVLVATHHMSKGGLIRRRMYRHLAGYATTTVVVRPDFGKKHPVIEIRDPLGSYPEPKAPEDLSPPANCAFVYQRSADWLRANYPQSRSEVGGPVGPVRGTDEDFWEMVEWLDDEVCVVGIVGPCNPNQSSAKWARESLMTGGRTNPGAEPLALSGELHRWENQGHGCPVITLPRVTLDKIASQIAHQVGNVDLMTRLLALAIAAEEKSVFADMYAIGTPNGRPSIISNNGQWADGRSGKINLLQDVHSVGNITSQASPGAINMVQMLESDMRVSTGLMEQMGGRTGGSMRTGRGLDTLVGLAVDPKVQELQEIFQYGIPYLNEIIFDMWKGYWGDQERTLMTGWVGRSALVTFTPNKHIEANFNAVQYPILGMDAQGLTVTLGQLLATQAISLTTLRQMHPYIDDPDNEKRGAMEEAIEKMTLDALAQQSAGGQIPPAYMHKIDRFVRQGYDVFEAIDAADQEAKAEQATQAPAPAPGQAAAPGQMPGLVPNGQPPMAAPADQGAPQGLPPGGGNPAQAGMDQTSPEAQAGGPPIGAPQASQVNLRHLLQALEAH